MRLEDLPNSVVVVDPLGESSPFKGQLEYLLRGNEGSRLVFSGMQTSPMDGKCVYNSLQFPNAAMHGGISQANMGIMVLYGKTTAHAVAYFNAEERIVTSTGCFVGSLLIRKLPLTLNVERTDTIPVIAAGTYRNSEALIIDMSDTALILVSAPKKVRQTH